MKINKTTENDRLTVSISGRIDTNTSPELEQELKNSFDGCNELVLDFKDVEYISSAGLRVLLMSNKTMMPRGGMKLKNIAPDIMEILEMTGFSDIFDIE